MANAAKRLISAYYGIKGMTAPLAFVLVAMLATGCEGFGEDPDDIPRYVAADTDTDTDADTDTDTDTDADTDTDTGPVVDTDVDVDNDGYGDSDCNDADATIYPGATEVCDSVDNDCDGDVDEGTASAWYLDGDGDGYGGAERIAVLTCAAPTADYVSNATDCDDTDNAVNPAAAEVCDDGDTDENCDGVADGEDASGATVWFGDVDGDGAGSPDIYAIACDAPMGYTDDVSDCDDADPTASPGGTEVCDDVDNDCDGDVDEDAEDASRWCQDADGDGYGGGLMDTDACVSIDACEQPAGYVANATDCDDADVAIYPNAAESCNGADDDCDGVVDEDDAADALTWYLDRDNDGYGDSASADVDCDAPIGYVADATDCDDTDSTAFPGGTEICDGADNDCDGTADNNATDMVTWYADTDTDSYGDVTSTTSACDAPIGYVADATDCDDASSSYHPGADEDDCTDPNDYNCDGSTQYEDDDGDGFAACEECDDTNAAVNPDADEVCNDVDDDCDGDIDGSNAVDVITWYFDDDGDGYGVSTDTVEACDVPAGYAATDDDCDDADAAFNPGAAEADCTDPNDYNCDGSVGYADDDGDGFAACEDCDDAEAAANADEVEACDGIDNDCDGTTDEDNAVDAATWYADLDGDGYGDSAVTDVSCDVPTGFVGNATDCDDTRGATNPTADETCNEVDDDCDGSEDESDAVDAATWYYDMDNDGYGEASTSLVACDAPVGYTADATDCDGTDDAVNPAATETCNEVDDDCDGSIDSDDDSVSGETSWYVDADEDGYGLFGSTATVQCDDPSTTTRTYADNDDDCRDTNDTVNPAASEVAANGLDDNCDGSIDE